MKNPIGAVLIGLAVPLMAQCQWTAQGLSHSPTVRIDAQGIQREIAIKALLPWAHNADVKFNVVSSGPADLVIRSYDWNQDSACYMSSSEGAFTRDGAIVVLDWNNANLFSIILHEVGHALGLQHSWSSTDVMYAILTHAYEDLGPGDTNAITARYRAARFTKVGVREAIEMPYLPAGFLSHVRGFGAVPLGATGVRTWTMFCPTASCPQ
jgi:hypothetical protein